MNTTFIVRFNILMVSFFVFFIYSSEQSPSTSLEGRERLETFRRICSKEPFSSSPSSSPRLPPVAGKPPHSSLSPREHLSKICCIQENLAFKRFQQTGVTSIPDAKTSSPAVSSQSSSLNVDAPPFVPEKASPRFIPPATIGIIYSQQPYYGNPPPVFLPQQPFPVPYMPPYVPTGHFPPFFPAGEYGTFYH